MWSEVEAWLRTGPGAAIASLVTLLAFAGIDARWGWNVIRRLAGRGAPATVQKVEVVTPEPQKTGSKFPKILPPPRDRTLVGREKELGRIRSLLASRHGVQITGQTGVALSAEGGRGKTALAKEYAWRFRDAYDGGYWLDAQTRANLLADLARLGERAFDMPVRDSVTEADGRAVLARIADSGARWLLVYDNADSYDEIPDAKQGEVRDLICQAPDVDVIVTSRRALGWDGYGRIDLEVLDTDSPEGGAVDLLLQEAGLAFPTPEDRQAAWLVAQELGGLPLALVLAGALVRVDGWSFAQLRDEVSEVLTRAPESPLYPNSVAGAVRLTYGRLGADAQALADLCAWLAPEGLTEALFAGAVKDPSWPAYSDDAVPEVRAVLDDPARLRAGLQELRRWSVLSGEGGMHRLTQAVLRAAQTEGDCDFASARGAAAVLAAQFPGGSENSPVLQENWEVCRTLVPHVRSLWGTSVEPWRVRWQQPGWAAMDYLLSQGAVFLSRQEDREGAIVLGRPALELKEMRLGEEHRDIPLALGNLALDLAEVGALAEARAKITRAVALDEVHRRREARGQMAGTYMQQAKIAFRSMEAGGEIAEGAEVEAEAALEGAGEIWETLFGAESEEMALVWNERGYLRQLQGRQRLQWQASSRALEITRALDDPDQTVLATYATNVGSTALELGRANDARGPLKEAYDLAREVYFDLPDHSHYVGCCKKLTLCLLVLARKGGRGARREAEALAARHGLDLAEMEAVAERFPLEPVAEA